MDADTIHETPGSKTKGFIDHSTAGGRVFILGPILLAPQVPQG